MTQVKGAVAIVTGASSGIGKETALALAREGARVVLAARRRPLLEEVAQAIHALGGEALVIPTDVRDREQVDHLVRETLARWGQVDILVANAGAYIRRPIRELRVEDLEESMAVNFYGSVYPVLAVLPHMLARGHGHIVLVTSMDAKKGIPPDGPYVAAKFALAGFGDVLRQELHGTGVRATVVFPGRVDTPLIADLTVPWISAKIPPTTVAQAILRGIRKNAPEVIVPWHARLLVYAQVISPRFADWAVRFLRLSGEERNATP
ncbi:MAG: SDR family NAD(P)-dependent oxidoreductase [Chloroflexi bacterium]|nr:SDR family NAD(P)-dependent oxidoreductase [Chloroflexota bacterium]